jgi:hypothetical protein
MDWYTAEQRVELRESERRWKINQETNRVRHMQAISREFGKKFETYADLMNEIDLLDTQSRTCKACGLICNDYDKLARHVGSERCRERLCKKQGKIFTPDAEIPKYCKHCKDTMQTKSWSRHIKSKKHINNVSKQNSLPIYCSICNKDFFQMKRPRRSFYEHLTKNPKHRKLCKDNPENQMIHAELLEKVNKLKRN